MRSAKVYVAGPMTGHEHHNFPKFDAEANRLTEAGYIVLNPADLDRVHEGWVDYPPEDMDKEFFIGSPAMKNIILRDICLLMSMDPAQGDFIYLMEGWKNSIGATAEFHLAMWLGLGVIYENTRD